MSTNKKNKINNLDKIYCKSVAKSIADVLKFSLNEDFRKQAFQSLGVLSTSQLETKLQQKLILISKKVKSKKKVKNKNAGSKLSQRTIPQNEIVNETNNSYITTMESTSHAHLPDICTKNWLKISSDKYKESIQLLNIKKHFYYSQPHVTIDIPKHPEPSLTSQRTSEGSETFITHLQYQKTMKLPCSNSEISNYYKLKFQKSFDDGNNYFKKNLKAHQSCHF